MSSKAPEGAPEAYYEPIPSEKGEVGDDEEYSLPENATVNDYLMHPYK